MSTSVRGVLVVDDEEANCALVQRALRGHFDVITTTSPEEGLRLLAATPVFLVVSDQRMPSMNGTEFLTRAREIVPHAVRALMTGYSDVEATAEAINAARVSRYLRKPYAPDEIRELAESSHRIYELEASNRQMMAQLEVLVGQLKEQKRLLQLDLDARSAELVTANRALREMATRDWLTELYNRRFFQNRLEEELHRAKRYELDLSLLIIDVDNFKQFNDRYGHFVGDEVLKQFAQVVSGQLRETDLVARVGEAVSVAARYGGEEFAVILTNTPQAGAVLVAERLRGAVASIQCESVPEAAITVSVGVASFPADGHTTEELTQCADARLYQAKDRGRNRVVSDSTEEN